MDNKIAILDEIHLLTDSITGARVFMETFNDKLDHMTNLFLDAEQKLHRAEARCAALTATIAGL